jgi:hypothetical protein
LIPREVAVNIIWRASQALFTSVFGLDKSVYDPRPNFDFIQSGGCILQPITSAASTKRFGEALSAMTGDKEFSAIASSLPKIHY